ncbi:ABC transporter ATP-binding protein/permease [Ensifer sp.]|jgi:putative ATP-binding cassette transporter|uniref:ABC transporter ATP-binding protein/permease n=1 Tax=Ensifer sp. TaxID=1872086 RepID=UPI002E0F3EAE|nr:SbmA/BacA-like family transporter [Ensifer sp.]
MEQQTISFRVTAGRFLGTVRNFAASEVGLKAKLLFGGLIALLCGLNGLNVVNNYVGRNFMTAIAERQMSEFVRQAVYYVAVFAILTVVGVYARFVEERLALLWREYLTRRIVDLYLEDETYYRLDVAGRLTYPDQRIAEDVAAFTVTTLSFVIMLFSSTLTVISFSGVLWSISPLLFGVAVLYAACGSYMTFVLGRPLIGLNYDRLDREASFRSGLIHVRENAESIMLAHGEGRQRQRLLYKLDELVANIRAIVSVNRNLGFFTGGYNWMIQLVPDLIIAPAFIRGEIEFGVVTQSGAAFAMLVGAFSLIVRQFNSISNFAAVVSRLSSLHEEVTRSHARETSIELVERDGPVTYAGLTLLSSSEGEPVLLSDLSVSIPTATRVLVTGSNPAPGLALFRAMAHIPTPGSGRIEYPAGLRFLPQRPYLPAGPLRQILVGPEQERTTTEPIMAGLLHTIGLERLVGFAGAFDVERDWEKELSLREQQLLALSGILLMSPSFVVFDRAEMTLGSEMLEKVMEMLADRSIGCVHIGRLEGRRDAYHAIIEYDDDGRWTWRENGP